MTELDSRQALAVQGGGSVITKEILKRWRACYSNQRLDELFGEKESLALREVLELDIPERDRVWVATRWLAENDREKLAGFTKGCMERVKIRADAAAAYAADAAAAAYAADAAAAAYAAAHAAAHFAERRAQIEWLMEAL